MENNIDESDDEPVKEAGEQGDSSVESLMLPMGAQVIGLLRKEEALRGKEAQHRNNPFTN